MSILLSEEQLAIATESARLLEARADLSRLLALVESTGEWDKRFWNTVIEQGWTAIGIPEAQGGIGLGLIELGLVAQACGANPVAVVVPCHRVVMSDGSIGGYSGLPGVKQALLAAEGALTAQLQPTSS